MYWLWRVQRYMSQRSKIWKINKTAHANNLEYCHVCTLCASKCPEGAITIERNAPRRKRNKKTQKSKIWKKQIRHLTINILLILQYSNTI